MSQSTDGRTHRWTEHKAQRRVEVLDAAIAAIEADGIDVTVQQIAERLGLPRPVVYRHFDGRRDLDEQIRGRILQQLLGELLPALRPDGTVQHAVAHAVGTYLHWVDRHPRLHHFLGSGSRAGSHQRPDTGSPVLAGARNLLGTRLAELIGGALRLAGADPAMGRPMAFGVLGLVDGVVNGWRSDPQSSLTSQLLERRLTESVLALLEVNARPFGIEITADTRVDDLLPGPRQRWPRKKARMSSTSNSGTSIAGK